MATTYRLEIVTPYNTPFDGQVAYTQIQTTVGSMGIMAHHAPLRGELAPGVVHARDANGEETVFAVSGGLVIIEPEHVTLLADTAETGENIDTDRARRAYEAAQAELVSLADAAHADEVKAKMMRALYRLQAVEEARKLRRGGLRH